MRIIQVTPSGSKSKSGNRTTAVRWHGIFQNLGHNVQTITDYHGQSADMMVAIHAWRSAGAIRMFKLLYPDRPLVLCLGGTDINQFIHTHPKETLKSMELADVLVCLHDLIAGITPPYLRHKLRVVYQSAKLLPKPRQPSTNFFRVSVISHMRDVKDPMRTAMAVRNLPKGSRIKVVHLGKAHSNTAAKKAENEMRQNPRYQWKGEVPGWRVRQELGKSHLMVISSKAEGGANVISEAIVAGVPIIASEIDGNIGLLGKKYSGYYPVGNTAELRKAILRAETDNAFMQSLNKQCDSIKSKFTIEREQESWRTLIKNIT